MKSNITNSKVSTVKTREKKEKHRKRERQLEREKETKIIVMTGL